MRPKRLCSQSDKGTQIFCPKNAKRLHRPTIITIKGENYRLKDKRKAMPFPLPCALVELAGVVDVVRAKAIAMTRKDAIITGVVGLSALALKEA